jgi:large subunit ribosomal protein L29
MKYSELKNMSVKELEQKLDDLKSELFNLRFQHTVNQLDNPLRLKAVRKDIARVMTMLGEKNA